MHALERFHALMHFRPVDRRPLWEWHYLDSTVARWHAEGLPQHVFMPEIIALPGEVIGRGDIGPQSPDRIGAYFNLDRGQPYCPGEIVMAPVNTGIIPAFEERILAEDERTRTYVDVEGVTKQVLKDVLPMMPRFLDFPVKDRQDFAAMQKRYDACLHERYPPAAEWEAFKTRARARNFPIGLTFDGFFGRIRRWMGLENCLYALHDDPWLFAAICDFHTEFILQSIERALAEVPIDYVNFWEDMAYKNGPLLSPRHIRQYMLPGYRRIVDRVRSYGIDVIFVDCDGNLDLLIPIWLEAGINGVWPIEIAAGNDPVALRQKYGRDLLLVGGIDKRELNQGKDQVHAEVMKKVPTLFAAGGYVPTVDHSVPPDVPFENYVYFRRLVEELA